MIICVWHAAKWQCNAERVDLVLGASLHASLHAYVHCCCHLQMLLAAICHVKRLFKTSEVNYDSSRAVAGEWLATSRGCSGWVLSLLLLVVVGGYRML